MTPLPKDIEEAIADLMDQYNIGSDSHWLKVLRGAIAHKILNSSPTQRQRYKEAALQGMYANHSMIDCFTAHPIMVSEIGKVADLLLAEDAEHAGKLNNEN